RNERTIHPPSSPVRPAPTHPTNGTPPRCAQRPPRRCPPKSSAGWASTPAAAAWVTECPAPPTRPSRTAPAATTPSRAHQGAATGVGGIVRDIISMGARPIAVMDQIRAGDVNHPDTTRVITGAVAGISHYAGTLGLPNIGGETEFDAAYQANPLVNALAVGLMRHEDIHLANASGAGNKVVLFGSRTGGDGIGGASVLSSAALDDDAPKPKMQ